MQEIARGVYIETAYVGVSLGAVNLPHGLILVDAPPRPEDTRSWRSALLNLSGGVDRLLVNLDSHFDRTLGARGMECTVVAHERTANAFRNRPTTFKPQSADTGAEWEQLNGLGSIRWAPPEVTFSNQLQINWGEAPLILEYHPGPNPGAIWVILPEARVVFVGDAVMPNQPPFLANADLPAWIETLQLLLSETYHGYLIVSGRDGLIPVEEIRQQSDTVNVVRERLQKLAEKKSLPEATEEIIPGLLSRFKYPIEHHEMYYQRLRWGLYHYYARHHHPNQLESAE